MQNKLIIIGGGAHAKVVADTISLSNEFEIVGFLDDNIKKGTPVFNSIQCIGNINDLSLFENFNFFIALGHNEMRIELANKLKESQNLVTIIHPKTIISTSARIEKGTIVLAGAIINTNSIIKENVIINIGTIVDHDCVVESGVHLSPGTIVGSFSKVSAKTKTEIGAKILSFSDV